MPSDKQNDLEKVEDTLEKAEDKGRANEVKVPTDTVTDPITDDKLRRESDALEGGEQEA